MYEDKTVEIVKSEIINRLTTDIDTREGSFTNDMVAAVAYEIWKLYQSLNAIVPIAFVDETSGEYIDKRCAEYGITRKAGTKATAVMNFTGTDGTIIPAGKVFLTADGLEYTTNEAVTIASGIASVTVTAAEIGENYNVEAGAITQQFSSISGLSSFTNEAAATGGIDAETDKALVARLYYYLQNPATSGNVANYKQWALAVNGVGAVKITPLWNGAGTVKVLIASSDKKPVDSAIVTNCATSIEANRPIGATVTVTSTSGLSINVAATGVTVDNTTTLIIAQTSFEEAVKEYLQEIAFQKYTLVYNRIVYILLKILGVIDFETLTVNNGTTNITIDDDQVPVIGTVVIS
jgi:uncharacterized phage protein gp47/JayE